MRDANGILTDDIILYYHNDHLGTPMFMSDETGAIVWRREQEPFGETTFERGTVSEQLRFPGQYWDAEKGSSYNFYRDSYDPGLGRYGQGDPIGQTGGVNIFNYTNNNPILTIDPNGLTGVAEAIIIRPPFPVPPQAAMVGAIGGAAYIGTSCAIRGTCLEGGIGEWVYNKTHPEKICKPGTLVPTTPQMPPVDLSGSPESCRLRREACEQACRITSKGKASAALCKSKCWIGYLGC